MKYLIVLLFSLNVLSQSFLPVSNGEFIQHSVLSISYSEKHEQAEWVYYESSSDLVYGSSVRQNDFRADAKVATGSAFLADYRGSGYDRGHLAPAQDMKSSDLVMSESFLLSNISPQTASFNRGGKWRQLEDAVHRWGVDDIIVVTGPVFKDNLGVIGANSVTVPGYFYKVIYKPSTQSMIAFLLPHRTDSSSLESCAVSVDSLEILTEIDFFPQLKDSIEDCLEGAVTLSDWDLKANHTYSKSSYSDAMFNQCKGIAKSTGKRCRIRTENESGYCQYHGWQGE